MAPNNMTLREFIQGVSQGNFNMLTKMAVRLPGGQIVPLKGIVQMGEKLVLDTEGHE